LLNCALLCLVCFAVLRRDFCHYFSFHLLIFLFLRLRLHLLRVLLSCDSWSCSAVAGVFNVSSGGAELAVDGAAAAVASQGCCAAALRAPEFVQGLEAAVLQQKGQGHGFGSNFEIQLNENAGRLQCMQAGPGTEG
jgi:hypothetical protein